MLWVAAISLLLSMADMICLVCRRCGVHSSAESVRHVGV